ncbi:MAG: D-alanyl-D-alanine carboxypeptidase family protein [Oscillospiraceae bacterium]
MARSNNKKAKKRLSLEARRRRNAARAKIASVLGVVAVCAGIGAVIITGSKAEIPLSVEADGYVCLGSEEVILPESTEDGGEAVPVAAETVVTEKVSSDPAADEVRKINIKLQDSYPIDMVIRSEYAIVYDVEANEVLYAKNPEEKCYPASTTKIMSSAITLKYAPEDLVFTAGDEQDLVNPGSSLAMLNRGSELDLGMIIDGMMLPSGNDAAYCAAANTGRVIADNENMSAEQAVKRFVNEMNAAAKRIGCKNTHFANPDGFHDDDHYTTVLDMLRVALYAENFDMLTESAAKTDRYVTFLSGEEISWENTNKLIHDYSDCYYMYATGMKTGMTDEAGHCVVATAERFGHQIICIVFKAPGADVRWNDTIALLDAAFVKVRERG